MVQRRNTHQRSLVMEAVKSLADHPTADEVYDYVRRQDEHVSRGTVYRNLNLLTEQGQVLDVKVPGADRFDFRTEPHAHMVCRQCGAVVDVPESVAAGADKDVQALTGYAEVAHYTVFLGLCPVCQAARKQGVLP